MRKRLDVLLVERGLAESREQAQALVMAGLVAGYDKPGQQVAQGAAFGSVESVKAAAEFYMPVDGAITETNDAAKQTPETINKDPYGAAWLAKVKVTNAGQLDSLLDAAAYEAYCKERLVKYKWPKHIEFLDALPKIGVGKINKLALKARG